MVNRLMNAIMGVMRMGPRLVLQKTYSNRIKKTESQADSFQRNNQAAGANPGPPRVKDPQAGKNKQVGARGNRILLNGCVKYKGKQGGGTKLVGSTDIGVKILETKQGGAFGKL